MLSNQPKTGYPGKVSFVAAFSVILIAAIIYACSFGAKETIEALPAHSHNDYEHARPLFDALQYRFKSIEADVFSIGDSLFVAHDFDKIKPGRTLRQLYLDPLRTRIAENNGSVYGNGEEIILLVDIKDDGLKTYQLLHKILTDYSDLLTSFADGKKQEGNIMVVISGNRPIEYMKAQTNRLAFVDGRLDHLDSGISPDFMPMISDNWTKHFTWNGIGDMPNEESVRLRNFAEKARNIGYLLRFWATPNQTEQQREAVWSELRDAGVGLIGVDELKELSDFLHK